MNPSIRVSDIIDRHGPMSSVALADAIIAEGCALDRPEAYRTIHHAFLSDEITYAPNDIVVLTALEVARRDKRTFDTKARLQEALAAYVLDAAGEHIIPGCADDLEQRIRAIVEKLP